MFYIRNYSGASFDRSINKPDKLVEHFKTNGYTIVGLCDFELVTNYVKFTKALKKHQITGIFAVELIYKQVNIVCIIMNDQGWNDLSFLLTRYHNQNLNADEIFINCTNLSCIVVDIHKWLNVYSNDYMIAVINELKGKFQYVYYELNLLHENNKELYFHDAWIYIKSSTNIHPIATFPNYYTLPEEYDVYQVFTAISCKKTLTQIGKDSIERTHIMDQDSIYKIYENNLDAIENLYILYSNIFLNFIDKQPFGFPNEITKTEYIKKILKLYISYKEKTNLCHKTYFVRLKYELKTVLTFNFENYFMLFENIISFCRTNNIIYNVRGSASGSLVLLLMKVINIDPIGYMLSFERFLNPGRLSRGSLPDIDLDITATARVDVINFLSEKYPEYDLCHILTYSRFTAKAILRAVGRARGLSFYTLNMLTRFVSSNIVNKAANTISESFKNDAFTNLVHSDKNIERVVQDGLKLEECILGYSQHAAGILLLGEENKSKIPLLKLNDNMVSMYDMKDVEYLGGVKLDILGLITFDIISYTIQLIKDYRNETIDIYNIKPTPELIKQLENVSFNGLFQIDTKLLLAMIRALGPDSMSNINQLADMLSLCRPGAISFFEHYADNRIRNESVKLYNGKYEALNSITSQTYGIVLYQEQIQQIAEKVAGFTSVEADILRYAVGKKDTNTMHSLGERFIHALITKAGFNKADAGDLWILIEAWSGYGFNLSHALSYATVTVMTLYLKLYYPAEFLTSLIKYRWKKENKETFMISDLWYHNIKIHKLNIYSPFETIGYNNNIYFGWDVYKGKLITSKDINDIIEQVKKYNIKNFIQFKEKLRFSTEKLKELASADIFDIWEDKHEILSNINSDVDTNPLLVTAKTKTKYYFTEKDVITWGLKEVEIYSTLLFYDKVEQYNKMSGYSSLFNIVSINFYKTQTRERLWVTIIGLEYVHATFRSSKNDEKELLVTLTDHTHTINLYIRNKEHQRLLFSFGIMKNIFVELEIITLLTNAGNKIYLTEIFNNESPELSEYMQEHLTI